MKFPVLAMKTNLWSLIIACSLLPGCAVVELADRGMNRLNRESKGWMVSEPACRFHRTLLVADAHADTLMLDRGGSRGMLGSPGYGHVDWPRLRKGNVSLQMFTVATITPVPYWEKFGGGLVDGQVLLTAFQGWPVRTWLSPGQRARHQAWKWQQICDDRHFTSITSQEDLRSYLGNRFKGGMAGWVPKEPGGAPVATVLGLEGAHALGLSKESSSKEVAERVAEFRSLGFRVMALTHRFDNRLAGASEGAEWWGRRGLTPLGRKVLWAMQEQGLIVDLAHLSCRAIEEVLTEFPKLPVMVSHGGIDFRPEGGPGSSRLMKVEHARRIAERGGVIGIGFWPEALQGVSPEKSPEPTPELVATMIRKSVQEFGSTSICLGSDMDGAVRCAFDASGYVYLTNALLEESKAGRMRPGDIRNVMGGNLVRFFLRSLPEK